MIEEFFDVQEVELPLSNLFLILKTSRNSRTNLLKPTLKKLNLEYKIK